MNEDEQTRFDCLKLAASSPDLTAAEVVGRAEIYHNFLRNPAIDADGREPTSKEKRAEAVRLYAEGVPFRAMSEKLGFSASYIAKLARKEGLPYRKPKMIERGRALGLRRHSNRI